MATERRREIGAFVGKEKGEEREDLYVGRERKSGIGAVVGEGKRN